MLRLRTLNELRGLSARWQAAGMLTGLVPTMGALHAGHRSLIRRARAECDRVTVSIFVNPRQFSPGEDIARYPRDPEADLRLLEAEGVDAVLMPDIDDVYPPGHATEVHVGGVLTSTLEGAMRPGHFDGVALVVAKLLVAAAPNRAYFGSKDAQQCAVVQRVAADLETGVAIVVCPTVRDADGLALSSRNVYLDDQQRWRARAIAAGLAAAATGFAAGERDPSVLCGTVTATLADAQLRVDYVAAVDPSTWEPAQRAAVGTKILVAARIDTTRLIDNLSLGLDETPVVDGGR